MERYFTVLGGVLIAVILSLTLKRQGKEFPILITLAVCVMVMVAFAAFLDPVVDFLYLLKKISGIESQYLSVMLKIVGIALLSEIASMVCQDAGESALGKTVGVLSTGVILWLSLPLMNDLLELVQKIVGEA